MRGSNLARDRTTKSTPKLITSLRDLSWYVGELSRHEAESLLFRNSVPGTFLLRKSSCHDEYALSVRTFESTTHFIVKYNPFDEKYTFGPEEFGSLSAFVRFFESGPTVKYDNAEKEVVLSTAFKNIEREVQTAQNYLPYEIATDETKEGYLIKRGAIHKNWKERWFAVHDDVLKYFNKRLDEKPLRSMHLSEASEVKESDIDNKRNCFCLVFPSRTFYLVAKCNDEKDSWIGFFQSRINYYKQEEEEDGGLEECSE